MTKEIVFLEGGRNQRIFERMWRFERGFWGEFDSKPPARTNLCQWVRVVVVLPVLYLFLFGFVAWLFVGTLEFMYTNLGDGAVRGNFFSYVVNILLLIAAIAAFFVARAFYLIWQDDRKADRSWITAAQPVQETSWRQLLWAYLKSLKARVCPTITYAKPVEGEIIQ